MSGRLRLRVHQFAPSLRDVAGNAHRIDEAARGADLTLTPELSLTGYDLGDDVHRLALALRTGEPLPVPGLESTPPVVVGLVERGAAGVPYNVAAVVEDGRVVFRHRKLYLPTYGMFDEMRFFGRGTRLEVYDAPSGWRVGVLVCEDVWHPGLAYILAARGVDLLLVQAAAPGRGAWAGGATGGRFASADVWERIARTTAQLYGIYVALANRTGAEGGVVFAGGSLVVAPTGEVLAAAGADEALLDAELSLEEVARARRPYAHARDEDLHFMMRELARAAEAGDER